MKFRITHTTTYSYNENVALCHNEAHLRPRNDGGQTCLDSRFQIDPAPVGFHDREDIFGNRVSYFAIEQMHDRLTVTVTSRVDVQREALRLDLAASTPWDTLAAQLPTMRDEGAIEARPFVLDSPLVRSDPSLAELARPSFAPGRPILEAAFDLTRRVFAEFAYDPTFTSLSTPLGVVVAEKRGVCQDFAHLAVGCLRSLGLPARYVSGYVETYPPADAPHLRGGQASHAWFAVFDPEAGWVDFDPTNDQIVGEQHVTLAWGRDYSDVAPLKGVGFGGGSHGLLVDVEMLREA